MVRRTAATGLLLCTLGLAGFQAAAQPTPPQAGRPSASEASQEALQSAVRAYEAGRLEEARAGFTALSAQRVPLADFNLAMMHLRGEMPQPSPREALRLLERAATSGFVTAQFTLGEIHEAGELVPRNLVLANRWYELAATSGSVDGQVAMGTAYYLGRGAAKDLSLAARWFREAAKGGDVGAQYLLASMYEQGDGVSTDLRLARYWYGVAAQNGDEAAPAKVLELDRRLSQPAT